MKSPFKFLDPYTAADKHLFFGREEEIETLYNMVFKTPLVLVYGMSGTGKTSLIQCGLSKRFNGPDWLPFYIRKEKDINIALRNNLSLALDNKKITNLSTAVSDLFYTYFRPVYLIFDQFEELFILGEKEEQIQFMQDIQQLIQAELPCKILFVMREEYIGQLYEFEKVVPGVFDFKLRVEPMNNKRVREVMMESFKQFNISLEAPEEGLCQTMIDNISAGKSGIPLTYLQVYLDMLYREDFARTYDTGSPKEALPPLEFTKAEVDQFGEIDDVLERYLKEQINTIQSKVTATFVAAKEQTVRSVIDIFVTEEGTKRPINYLRQEEEIQLEKSVENILQLPTEILSFCIKELDQARLLRLREDTIELGHDTLAELIDQQRSNEQRKLNDIKKRLLSDYKTYQQTGEYLSEKRLNTYEDFLPDLNLKTEQLTFIANSKKQIDINRNAERDRQLRELKLVQEKLAAEEQSRKRQNQFSLLLGIALLAAIGLGLWAVQQRNSALSAKKEADANFLLAKEAEEKSSQNLIVAQEAEEKAIVQQMQTNQINTELIQKQAELKSSQLNLENTLKKLRSEKSLSDQRLKAIRATNFEIEATVLRNEILELKKQIEQLEIQNTKTEKLRLETLMEQKYIQGISYCDSALFFVGHAHSVYRTMGDLHVDMFNYTKAIQSFKLAIKDLEQLPRRIAYLKKGAAASNEADSYEDALFFYTELIATQTNPIYYLSERAKTFRTLGNLRKDRQNTYLKLAIKDISSAIEVAPANKLFDLYLELAEFHELVGDFDMLEADLARAIEHADSNSLYLAYSRLGDYYLKNNKFSEALDHYKASGVATDNKEHKKLLESKITNLNNSRVGHLDSLTVQLNYTYILRRADSLFEIGNYQMALENYQRLVQYKELGGLEKKIKLTQDRMRADFNLPKDNLLAYQWTLQNVGTIPNVVSTTLKKGADAKIVEAWEYMGNMGSSDIVVAVVDNGFDLEHPDLKDKIYKPYDLWNQSNEILQGDPRFTAGTANASVALAAADGKGMVGAAPNAQVMPISGTSFSIRATEEMFGYAYKNGADIISCSWGTIDPSYAPGSLKQEAIARAAREGRNGKGCVILFAAGNNDLDYLSYYATHPDVIAVGASTSQDIHAAYSNRGKELTVVAPSNGDWPIIAARASWDEGTSVRGKGDFRYWSDGKSRGANYKHFGGTSAATSLVAGICALILSVNPHLTAKEVKEVLIKTADKIGDSADYDESGHSLKYGYGRVNALKAVKEAENLLIKK